MYIFTLEIYWLYLAYPYSSFHVSEGLSCLPSTSHAFHQISLVIEGTWITEVNIYS